MTLCVNISPLSDSMTRVEKYREYRKEISNMKFETLTTKHQAAMQVDKFHDMEDGNKLDYEHVMIVHDVYDDGGTKLKKRKVIRLTKYEIFYCSIAFVIIALLLASIIIVGIHSGGRL